MQRFGFFAMSVPWRRPPGDQSPGYMRLHGSRQTPHEWGWMGVQS